MTGSMPGATAGSTGTYRSTVVAPAQVALGVLGGGVVAAILEALDPGLWPVALVVLVGCAVLGYLLASVSLTVGQGRITIGQGRWEREARVIHASEVREMSGRDLTWAQCFGAGTDPDERTTRLSVRRGPTLFLVLYDGEEVRISTADPTAAIALIDTTG